MKKLVMVTMLIFAGFVLLTSCQSTTDVFIDSEPQGADIYVDGEFKGKTPTYVEMSNVAWDSSKVTLKKDGYKPMQYKADKEGKTSNILTGIFLWWPSLFYCYGPESTQYFTLIPETPTIIE